MDDLEKILIGALVVLLIVVVIAVIAAVFGGAKRRRRRQVDAEARWAQAWGAGLTETRWVCDDLTPTKYPSFAHEDIARLRELEARYTKLEAVTPNTYVDRHLSKLRKTLGTLVVSVRGLVESGAEDPGEDLVRYAQVHSTFVNQVDNLVSRA